MSDALASFILLAFTIAILLFSRSRGLFVHMLVEAGLLVGIGAFLLRQGSSPLPHFGLVPAGLVGAWLRALAITWWLIGARFVVNLVVIARGRTARSREARLFSDLAAAVIYITTILIILNSVLGFNITGLVATSGVIAIVLGLALQNTLADVFSGIAVGLERPFHVGDRVSVGDDIEGVVVQMNWRSIRIQTDGEDLATIPNSIVAKEHIINRSVPTRRRATSTEITVPADLSSATVFELMRQATLLCPTILAEPSPSVSVVRSGIRSCTYATRFFVPDSPSIGDAKSNLLRQTRRLLHHAGIGCPSHQTSADLLGSLVLFEALTPKDLEHLASKLVVHVVEPGEPLFEQGATATSIYVIEAGVLEITRHNPSRPLEMIGRVGPGEYVGELGLMTGAPRAFTMKALTSARVLELPGDCLHLLIQSNDALGRAMERSVRKGLALLDRDDAARDVQPAGQTADLFARLKAFFGLTLGQPRTHQPGDA